MIAIEPVKAFLRKRTVKPLGAACVRKAFCDSYWPGASLQDAGYILDGLCPLCLLVADTLFHRIWVCTAEAAAAARAKASPAWFQRLARQSGINDPRINDPHALGYISCPPTAHRLFDPDHCRPCHRPPARALPSGCKGRVESQSVGCTLSRVAEARRSCPAADSHTRKEQRPGNTRVGHSI